MLVGLCNPKTLIFFISFLPQFIHAGHGSYVSQVLVLGGIYWVMGASWDLTLAWASGSFGAWLQQRPRLRSAQQRGEGLAYLTLAGWSIASGE
jgi:threonine/homoserine/homoserine lactone efflux protein